MFIQMFMSYPQVKFPMCASFPSYVTLGGTEILKWGFYVISI